MKIILVKKQMYISIIIITTLFLASSLITTVSAAYPNQRIAHSMTYDVTNDRIIMYGGATTNSYVSYSTETWVYDLNTNTWALMSPESVPYQKIDARIAYDLESEKTVCFSGVNREDYVSDETWIYDYSADSWTNANPTTAPHLRSGHAMIYDSESDIIIMCGGGLAPDYNPYGGRTQFNDTWAYNTNTNTWTNMTPAISPLGRGSGRVAYDAESDRIVLFGGAHSAEMTYPEDPTGEVYQNSTWTYNYNTNTWEDVTPLVSPSPRYGHYMVYDSESDKIILYGGYTHLDTTSMENEVWSFDLNSETWTQMNPAPIGRRWHIMAYDSESDRTVFFGGSNTTSVAAYFMETWSYDYNTDEWTLMPIPVIDDSSMLILPTIISLSVIAIILLKRRKNK